MATRNVRHASPNDCQCCVRVRNVRTSKALRETLYGDLSESRQVRQYVDDYNDAPRQYEEEMRETLNQMLRQDIVRNIPE